MDENVARRAFEMALASYKPDFETFFLARLFGLDFSYGENTCRVEFPVHAFMDNPQGSLHGGVIAFVLDVSMGHLIKHVLGTPGVTLEMKVQYLATVRPPRASCEARFLREGRSIAFLEAHLRDAHGNLAAVATSTWRISPGPG